MSFWLTMTFSVRVPPDVAALFVTLIERWGSRSGGTDTDVAGCDVARLFPGLTAVTCGVVGARQIDVWTQLRRSPAAG